jgi:hypothetical protein
LHQINIIIKIYTKFKNLKDPVEAAVWVQVLTRGGEGCPVSLEHLSVSSGVRGDVVDEVERLEPQK